MVGGDFADNRGVLAERVRAHRSKNAIGLGGRNNREEFTFIGDIKRIETEDLACPLDFFADGDLSFIEQPSKIDSTIPLSGAVSLSIFVWNSNPGCLQMHAHPCSLCNFAQRASDASTGGIPQG